MSIKENIKKIVTEIRRAEREFNRSSNSVSLLMVSKSQSLDTIKVAITAGQKRVGENYVQEALPKIKALRDYGVEWHFIGGIQSNKTRLIATYFDWVQSVSCLQVAEALHRYRPLGLIPLSICIQVNISEEKNKSGVNLENVSAFAKEISSFDRLRLRGLMAMSTYYEDFCTQRMEFEKLKKAQQQLIKKGLSLDILSLGMTHDFRSAIAVGSTMVRIGTGVFGSRERR